MPHTDPSGVHVEHFPVMKSFIVEESDLPKVRRTLPEGVVVEFDQLVLHGGVGSTLEFRVFSEKSLWENLASVGFTKLKPNPNLAALGISWEK